MRSNSHLEVAAATAAACKLIKPELLPAIYGEVSGLLNHTQPLVRKRATLQPVVQDGNPTFEATEIVLERDGLEVRAKRARQALAAAAATGIRPAAILGADAAALIPGELTPGGRIVVPEAPAMGNAAAALLGGAGPLQLVTLEISAARGTTPDQIRRDDPVYLRAADVADNPQG